jgi:hypothetical protein
MDFVLHVRFPMPSRLAVVARCQASLAASQEWVRTRGCCTSAPCLKDFEQPISSFSERVCLPLAPHLRTTGRGHRASSPQRSS